MKLLRESIDCEICLPTEEEIAEFIANHLPSEEYVKTKILEINPNFDYKENIYFKIKDRIESVIRSTMEDYSCEEADAISYIDIVFDDIKAHAFDDPELENIYNIAEPQAAESGTLVESEDSSKHLRDILKGIEAIYIYNDARQAHLQEDLTESDGDVSSDELLLSWPDDKLLELPEEKIHEIRNLKLIHRIARQDKSKLSAEQLQSIQEFYKKKWFLDKEDVEALIEYLKECHRLYIAERPKNESLLRLYDLTTEDCLDIIHDLTVSDYIANTANTHYDYLGNHVVIFEPTNIQLPDGRDLGDLLVYIKLDLGLEEEPDHATTSISFHKTTHEDPKPYKGEEDLLEEEVQSRYFEITYRHETGIYATDAIEASSCAEAKKLFEEQGRGEVISCDPISKEEYEEIRKGLDAESIEESADESRYHPSRYSRFWWGIIDSNNGLLMRVGPDADYSKPLDDAANKLLLFKSKEETQEYIDKNLVETLTEDLNVNVDTEEQNINVAAEENATVEVKVAPKNCIGVECDAEAELAELAKDPKYAKAFAYLMKTLQSEEVEDQPAEEKPVEEVSAEEPITESVEEPVKEPMEEKDTEEEDTGEASDSTPEGPSDMYAANALNDLTKSEYETINAYNDFLLAIQSMVTRPEGMPEEEEFKPSFCPELAEQVNEVIKDILAEENKHIGQLQELLKKVSPNAENIEAGADEAKEQIEEVEVND